MAACLGFPFLGLFSGLVGSAVSGVTGGLTLCCTTHTATALCKSYNCHSSVATRVGYSMIFFINSLLAWSMLTPWFADLISKYTSNYIQLTCTEGKCFGVLAVHRVCFGLALLHLLLAILLIGVKSASDRRAEFQNGWWGPKIFLWIIFIILSFYIPNGFFIWYSNFIAPFGAAYIIFVGLALLIDFAHTWSEKCLRNYEDSDNNSWIYILVGSTIGLLLLSVTMDAVGFKFHPTSEHMAIPTLSIHVLMSILVILISIHPKVQDANPKSGIAQASMVVAYTTYLIVSGILARSESRCSDGGAPFLVVILGAFFTFTAVAFSTSRAAMRSSSFLISGQHSSRTIDDNDEFEEALPLVSDDPSAQQLREQAILAAISAGSLPPSALQELQNQAEPIGGGNDERSHTQYNYVYFHIVFILATMYIAMLLTDWAEVVPDSDAHSTKHQPVMIGCSSKAMWVKIYSAMICYFLYIWSLIAPIVSPHRFLE